MRGFGGCLSPQQGCPEGGMAAQREAFVAVPWLSTFVCPVPKASVQQLPWGPLCFLDPRGGQRTQSLRAERLHELQPQGTA